MSPTPMPGTRAAVTAGCTFRRPPRLVSSAETRAWSHSAKRSCSPPSARIDSKNSVGGSSTAPAAPAAPKGPPCSPRRETRASVVASVRRALIASALVSVFSYGPTRRAAIVRNGFANRRRRKASPRSVPVLYARRSGGEADHLLEHLELQPPVGQQVLHRHAVGVSLGLLEAAPDLGSKFGSRVARCVASRADELSHQREDLTADYEPLQVHATATKRRASMREASGARARLGRGPFKADLVDCLMRLD